jgi:hypothetical protein
MVDRILYWNCAGGIKSKIDYLRDFVKGKNFNLIFISESDILERDIALIKIESYDIILANTSSNGGKARMLCYVWNGLKHKKVRVSNMTLDIIAIEVNNCRFVGVYIPFKLPDGTSRTNFFKQFIAELENLSRTEKDIMIGGDFNVDLNKPSSSLDKLENWALNSGLVNLVEKGDITRMRIVKTELTTRLESSTIDHVYSNLQTVNINFQNSISDHVLLVAEIPTSRSTANKSKIIIRDWRNYNETVELEFANRISQISPNLLTLETLTDLYKTTLDEVAPLRVVRHHEGEIINTKVAALQKRRDRYLKKYKKTGKKKHLDLAKSFSCTLKKAVKKEARRVFQCKARSPNPNHFWAALNEKMGKFRDGSIELVIEGESITDDGVLSEKFANFFIDKVNKLVPDKINSVALSKPLNPVRISVGEIEIAAKSLSNKKSYGIDGVPQNLLRDTIQYTVEPVHRILNSFCTYGLPDYLKTARVTPLHKKASKMEISNYRPISNLSVFSKIYEKCLLSRLNDELGDQEGDHQHGFRKNHSTETALLTLQSYMANALDSKKNGLIYSVDLSAAFDLLKPDKFFDMFKDKLSEGLLFCIMDFLTARKFIVQVNECCSDSQSLDRGCVQGSILGPKLFSLYVAALKNSVVTEEIKLVSYADDSYVIVIPKDQEPNSIKSLTERTLTNHIDYLRSIGMVVNEDKTEVMWLGVKGSPFKTINIGGNEVALTSNMKALGIYLQGNLAWDTQAEVAINKSKKLLSAFRFLRKYLNEKQFLKAASANYYGSVYYGATVWYHSLKQKYKTKLTSTHFRMLRTAKRDYKLKFKRTELTELCKRATPEQWTRFLTATRVVKIVRNRAPTDLYRILTQNYFEEKRNPHIGMFFDSSRTRKGRQSIQNRLMFMRSISYPWNSNLELSNDLLRVTMKRTFFPYYK